MTIFPLTSYFSNIYLCYNSMSMKKFRYKTKTEDINKKG